MVQHAADKALRSGLVYKSPNQGRRYQIADIGDKAIVIDRLDGNKPATLGKLQVERAVQRLNASGGMSGVRTLVYTVALETTLVTLHPHLTWTPDAQWITTSHLMHEGLPELAELEEEEMVSDLQGVEGAVRLQTHRRRERDSKLMARFKGQFIRDNMGSAPCQVCGFDFHEAFGPVGIGYIEAHHIHALSSADQQSGQTTRYQDIAFLCANCHRMSHRLFKGRWLTLDELRELRPRQN